MPHTCVAVLVHSPTASSDSSPVMRLSSRDSVPTPEGGDAEMLSGMEYTWEEGTT